MKWNDDFSNKRLVNGKRIIIGQQDFESMTILVKEENENIIRCPMDLDDDGEIYFFYDNTKVYVR